MRGTERSPFRRQEALPRFPVEDSAHLVRSAQLGAARRSGRALAGLRGGTRVACSLAKPAHFINNDLIMFSNHG